MARSIAAVFRAAPFFADSHIPSPQVRSNQVRSDRSCTTKHTDITDTDKEDIAIKNEEDNGDKSMRERIC